MTLKQLKIRPHTAANSDLVISNIKSNMENIPVWLEKCKIHSETAVIASAGPSLERMFKAKKGETIFCVKHSLKRLLKMGVVPDYCILLDGRDANEDSTLGYNRLNLVTSDKEVEVPKSVKFLVASMAHEVYAKHLLSQGYQVFGWHALVKELKEFPNITHAISGGTCSTVRALGIALTMGFRKTRVYGVDSSFEAKPDDDKYIETFVGQGDDSTGPIYTTPELAAQAQDLENILKSEELDMEVEIFSEGLVGELVKRLPNKTVRPYYKDQLQCTP